MRRRFACHALRKRWQFRVVCYLNRHCRLPVLASLLPEMMAGPFAPAVHHIVSLLAGSMYLLLWYHC